MALLSRRPLVSVIIPSYNHEQYIGEAVESVLNSSLSEVEVVVVDDGSTDGSADVVARFEDARVRLFRQPNSGAHAAINRGAELARASWLAILNSDDRFHTKKLQRHVELHESEPQLEASASRARYISGSGAPLDAGGYVNWAYERLEEGYRRSPSLMTSLLVANHIVTTSALFVSKEAFYSVGGFLPLRYVHDWFFFLALAGRGRFSILEESLIDYRIHSRNTIRENDALGLVEDNFVLDWHLSRTLKATSSPTGVTQLLDTLKQNKRARFKLLVLFQLWRAANDDDLEKCAAIFRNTDHPLIQRALSTVREERGLIHFKTRARKFLGERAWAFLADGMVKGLRLLTCLWAYLGLSRTKS